MSQQRVKSVYASYKKSLGTKTITVKETAITKTLSSNIICTKAHLVRIYFQSSFAIHLTLQMKNNLLVILFYGLVSQTYIKNSTDNGFCSD